MSLQTTYLSFFSRSNKGYVKGGTQSLKHARVSGTKVHGLRPLSLKIGLRYLLVCFSVWSIQHAIISHRDVIAPSPTPLLETLSVFFFLLFLSRVIYIMQSTDQQTAVRFLLNLANKVR